MISDTDLAITVSESAKQLDRDVPGWHDKIDLDEFNVLNTKNCICGQLDLSGPNPDKDRSSRTPHSIFYSVSRGFYCPEPKQDSFLQELWTEEIQQRRF